MNNLTCREFKFIANINPGDTPFFGVVSPEGGRELIGKSQEIERLRLAFMEQIAREAEISWD